MKSPVIAIIGLGYVGLPLAVAFGKCFVTVGFDTSELKINNYKKFVDPSGEIDSADIREAKKLTFTSSELDIERANIFIVAVPTPVDQSKAPDFAPLIEASAIIGRRMKKGSIVVYESTVYPGATEEICVPTLVKISGMEWKKDFNVGYSPERVNPGDKINTLAKIVKVVAGDTEETSNKLYYIYNTIINAGIHKASSIKVAEASKVIENTQRDLNIALMNELSLIFDKMNIDTIEVLEAAETKWNF